MHMDLDFTQVVSKVAKMAFWADWESSPHRSLGDHNRVPKGGSAK